MVRARQGLRSPREATGSPRLPSFLVIGAMRSGTTSLARYLGEHPDVFISTPKELHFFDWNWKRGLDWYADRFSAVRAERAVGEATPGYMYFGDALERMAAACPEARLVAILRNPVDRAYSHYWFNRSLRIEPLAFAQAIEREPERMTTHAVRRVFAYVDMGRYQTQIERVCTYYPRSSLHVVLFEEMISDPFAVYSGICRFLGVDDGFKPSGLGERTNQYAEFRSRGVQRLVRSMPRGWRRRIGLLNRRPGTYPPLDADLRRKLAGMFAEGNERLARWMGRDLSAWRVD